MEYAFFFYISAARNLIYVPKITILYEISIATILSEMVWQLACLCDKFENHWCRQ